MIFKTAILMKDDLKFESPKAKERLKAIIADHIDKLWYLKNLKKGTKRINVEARTVDMGPVENIGNMKFSYTNHTGW